MAVSMGNVKNEKIKDIIFSEKFMNFKDIIRKNKTISGCNRCGWLRSTDHK
jgi:sulfatase maturation enzyme AslB (radical SAM superfamily)